MNVADIDSHTCALSDLAKRRFCVIAVPFSQLALVAQECRAMQMRFPRLGSSVCCVTVGSDPYGLIRLSGRRLFRISRTLVVSAGVAASSIIGAIVLSKVVAVVAVIAPGNRPDQRNRHCVVPLRSQA